MDAQNMPVIHGKTSLFVEITPLNSVSPDASGTGWSVRRPALFKAGHRQRPKLAHGFNRGLRVENGQSPGRRRAEAALWRAAKTGGAIEKMGLDRCVLSSLTGLVLYSRHNPAMNRWAILERPCGT